MNEDAATYHRICPICEAACGLRISAKSNEVIEIRGNDDDVFSSGHTCAKGIALQQLNADPDRIRTPLIRKNNELVPGTWEEAYEAINQGLQSVIKRHGRNSVATYVGNPTAHNIGLAMGMGVFGGALGSTNFYSAGSVDQIPKQLASELMFGNDMAIPVPDILNCDYLLMMGANPVVSNGSLWVVPKVRDKLRELKRRGGKLVTVDPRRTETARMADGHYFIRPGTDALLLCGIINRLREIGHEIPKQLTTKGSEQLLGSIAAIDMSKASKSCGISESDISAIATQLSDAERPVVYGRVGTTLQAFGTLTSFLIEIVNLLIGAMDKRGGAMFPEQPFHSPGAPKVGVAYDRYRSRVSEVPEVLGQFPVTMLAEEIETEGDGQIRGLVCFAGNPVLSNPDSDRLASALDDLEFIVCVDIYHTETSGRADVVLPGSSPFEDSHYDQFLGSMGYKNAARFSPAIFEASQPTEWDIGLTLGFITQFERVPSEQEHREFEDNVVAAHVSAQVADPESGLHQRDVQEIIGEIGPDRGVERILDAGIRAGRWGDHFGARDGLTLQQMIDTPNGIDLGDIREDRLSEVVRHPDRTIDLAPDLILRELERLATLEPEDSLTLIGRRSTRSNNTWLRNLTNLNQGSSLCDLYLHPHDARSHEIEDGETVVISGPGGSATAQVQITEDIAKGVVCLPHGFDNKSEVAQSNLAKGPNYNRLASVKAVDTPSGTAALNGIPVTIQKSGGAYNGVIASSD